MCKYVHKDTRMGARPVNGDMKMKENKEKEEDNNEQNTLDDFLPTLVEWLKVTTIQARLDSKFTKELLGDDDDEEQVKVDEQKSWPENFEEDWV
jgi:hypothetical protein